MENVAIKFVRVFVQILSTFVHYTGDNKMYLHSTTSYYYSKVSIYLSSLWHIKAFVDRRTPRYLTLSVAIRPWRAARAGRSRRAPSSTTRARRRGSGGRVGRPWRWRRRASPHSPCRSPAWRSPGTRSQPCAACTSARRGTCEHKGLW